MTIFEIIFYQTPNLAQERITLASYRVHADAFPLCYVLYLEFETCLRFYINIIVFEHVCL